MPAVETTSLDTAAGRVLARDVLADRPYPALDRTARDGFAVRSSDMPGRVRVIGEVRAGERFDRLGLFGERRLGNGVRRIFARDPRKGDDLGHHGTPTRSNSATTNGATFHTATKIAPAIVPSMPSQFVSVKPG